MTTIIATENFNVTEPSTKIEQYMAQEYLIEILKELKKMNIHLSIVSDNEITDKEIE